MRWDSSWTRPDLQHQTDRETNRPTTPRHTRTRRIHTPHRHRECVCLSVSLPTEKTAAKDSFVSVALTLPARGWKAWLTAGLVAGLTASLHRNNTHTWTHTLPHEHRQTLRCNCSSQPATSIGSKSVRVVRTGEPTRTYTHGCPSIA